MRPWHLALVVLACVTVYSNTFENGLHLDDSYRVEDNPGVRVFWPPWRHFAEPETSSHLPRLVQYRPLLPLSLSINYAIAGDSLVGYHAGNLLFQVLASVLVYFLARELSTHWLPSHWQPTPAWPHAPLLVALLFAVHPVSGILVNYVCSRDLLMMQVFLVGALWGYVRMRRLGDTPLRWAVCVVCLLLSMMAKKNAVMFPALVALFELLLGRGPLSRLWRVLPFVAVIGGLLLFVRLGLGFANDYGNIVSGASSRVEYATHQLQHHVFHYLRNFVWPFRIRQLPVDPIADWRVVAGGACLLGSWGLAAYWWRRRPFLAFCILGYQALVALTSSVLPLFDEIVAYRPYPASVFLYLGAVALAARHAPGRVVLVAAVVYLGAASFAMNPTWKTERSLWQHSVDFGGSANAHYNLAMAMEDHEPEKRRQFEAALGLDSGFIVAHIGYGLMQIRVGEAKQGLERLRLAVRLDRNRAQSHYWLAQGYVMLKRYGEALTEALAAMRLQPSNVRYRYYAGQRASEAGDFPKVIEVLEPLHRHFGGFEHSGLMLGFACMKQKDWPKAARYYEEYLARWPQYADVHLDAAKCYRAMGRHADAERHEAAYRNKRK